MMEPCAGNMAVLARWRFIDFLLDHYGTLNRSALVDYFGISLPQATHDIQGYLRHAPGNAEYSMTTASTATCARTRPPS